MPEDEKKMRENRRSFTLKVRQTNKLKTLLEVLLLVFGNTRLFLLRGRGRKSRVLFFSGTDFTIFVFANRPYNQASLVIEATPTRSAS